MPRIEELYYQCNDDPKGNVNTYFQHWHRRIDNQMANPHTGELYPEQWCRKVNQIIGGNTCGYFRAHSYHHSACCEIGRKQAKEVKKMGPAISLWCEVGDHSFSSKKGHVEIERTIFDGDGNEEDSKTVTTCLEHDPYKSQEADKPAINGKVEKQKDEADSVV